MSQEKIPFKILAREKTQFFSVKTSFDFGRFLTTDFNQSDAFLHSEFAYNGNMRVLFEGLMDRDALRTGDTFNVGKDRIELTTIKFHGCEDCGRTMLFLSEQDFVVVDNKSLEESKATRDKVRKKIEEARQIRVIKQYKIEQELLRERAESALRDELAAATAAATKATEELEQSKKGWFKKLFSWAEF